MLRFKYESAVFHIVQGQSQKGRQLLEAVINQARKLYSLEGCLYDDRLYLKPLHYLTLALEDLDLLDEALSRYDEAISFCAKRPQLVIQQRQFLLKTKSILIKLAAHKRKKDFLKKALDCDNMLVEIA
jgi:tetratricopeptide (TPR) repeat protein